MKHFRIAAPAIVAEKLQSVIQFDPAASRLKILKLEEQPSKIDLILAVKSSTGYNTKLGDMYGDLLTDDGFAAEFDMDSGEVNLTVQAGTKVKAIETLIRAAGMWLQHAYGLVDLPVTTSPKAAPKRRT